MAAPIFKSFISEKEIEAVNKKKQEEWERVRRPDQPLERPQEVYDNRTLYERLKQQKDKKQEEWEDQFKFKNMIYKGLDEEEAGFLTLVADKQAQMDAQAKQRETEEVSEYREAVARLQEESEASATSGHLTPPTLTTKERDSTQPVASSSEGGDKKPVASKLAHKSQLALIAGSIKTKRKRNPSSEGVEKKPRLSMEEGEKQGKCQECSEEGREGKPQFGSEQRCDTDKEKGKAGKRDEDTTTPSATLSGLVAYCDSSGSSDTED